MVEVVVNQHYKYIFNPHLIISGPYGRFGNNMFQLFNILFLADIFKTTCDLRNLNRSLHWFLDLKKVQENVNKDKQINNNARIWHNYFFINDLKKNINPYSPFKIGPDMTYWASFRLGDNYRDYHMLFKKYIENAITIKPNPLDERICCIHMRCGDIFKNSFNPPCDYVQPPLAFYWNIIKDYDKDYDKFLIVTQKDFSNPCIKFLKQLPKVEIQTKSLKEDIETMLSAQTLVLSTSSLPCCLSNISSNVKRIFVCNGIANNNYLRSGRRNFRPNVQIKLGCFTKGYIQPKTWRILPWQLNKMINYKPKDLKFIDI